MVDGAVKIAWHNWIKTIQSTSRIHGFGEEFGQYFGGYDNSEVATLPATNLLNNQPSIPWRSLDNGEQTLSGSFDKTRLVNYVCLYNHNFSFETTIRVKLLDYNKAAVFDQTFGAYNISYGFGQRFGEFFGGYSNEGWVSKFTVKFFDTVAAASYQVILSGATEDYYQAGLLRIGDSWSPEDSNIAWGYALNRVDESQQTITGNGGVRTERKPTWRTQNLKFTHLTESDEVVLWDLIYSAGKTYPILVSAYPAVKPTVGRHHTMMGVLTEWSEIPRETVCTRSLSLSIREVK